MWIELTREGEDAKPADAFDVTFVLDAVDAVDAVFGSSPSDDFAGIDELDAIFGSSTSDSADVVIGVDISSDSGIHSVPAAAAAIFLCYDNVVVQVEFSCFSTHIPIHNTPAFHTHDNTVSDKNTSTDKRLYPVHTDPVLRNVPR